jgi:hypothetical protein
MTRRERNRTVIAATGLFGGIGILLTVVQVLSGALLWQAFLVVIGSYISAALLTLLVYYLVGWVMKP